MLVFYNWVSLFSIKLFFMRLNCLLFFVLISSLVFSSCQDNTSHTGHGSSSSGRTPKTAEDSLFHQVMEVHDEVMPKMGKIRGAQQAAQQRLDSLSLKTKSTDNAYRRQLEQLISDLNYADFAMDKWMVEFNTDSLKDNLPLRMQYLQSELDKVKKVKSAILNSLSAADSLLRLP